jgi:iron(III) transport system permease protein
MVTLSDSVRDTGLPAEPGAGLVVAGSPSPRSRGRRLVGRLVRPSNVLPIVLLCGLAFLVIYPLVELLIGSFKLTVPGAAGPLTLADWRSVLSSQTVKTALTTLKIEVPRSLLSVTLATTFAWLLARTNIPGKKWLFGMIIFMFMLPELPWILAWTQLGAHVGILNSWISLVIPNSHWINVYSPAGLIILGGSRGAVFLFFFLYPAFLGMDSSLEEAARMSGASSRRTLVRIVAPLLAPALIGGLIFSLIFSFSSFELEQLIGIPAGLTVFTTAIYNDVYGGLNQFGPAAALAMMLLVVTLALIALQWKLLSGRNYQTVSGKGFRAQPMDIGRWRWVAFGGMSLFFVFMGLLPFTVLGLETFMSYPGLLRFNSFTTLNWTQAFQDDTVVSSIEHTIFVALVAASIGIVLSFLISYVVVKTKWWGRKLMELTAWLPWAIPGTVLSLGFLYAFVPLPIYGTIWILVLAFVGGGLPIGLRFSSPTLQQIGPELEESARVHGASWLQTGRKVLLPLIRPSIVGAWVFLFVVAVRSLDTILILSQSSTRMLSVDIFVDATSGAALGEAYVLAIVQSGIVILGFGIARLLMGKEGFIRGGRQQAR